jgi:acyl dehydratase
MPVRADAIGTKVGPREVSVTPRALLAYAAGVGATSEIFLDDARVGGVVGFPAYCVALEWPVARVSGARGDPPLGLAREEMLRGVHATQDSCFHRPIRPGDRLLTEGSVVEIRPTRAGALVRTRLSTRDAAGGPVVTSWSASLFRGVGVAGEASALETPPPLPERELLASDLESIEIPVAREAPHVYTECADIWNPIHTERTVALAAGLPDLILHGTATWALAAREILRRRAGDDPARLRRLHGRFAAMVIPGEPIRIELGSLRDGAVAFRVRNARGELALRDGIALLSV